MAVGAARRALEMAKLDGADVDLIIVADHLVGYGLSIGSLPRASAIGRMRVAQPLMCRRCVLALSMP